MTTLYWEIGVKNGRHKEYFSKKHGHNKTHRPKIQGALVIGRNAVREVLRHKPDRVLRIISAAQRGSSEEIFSLAHSAGLEVESMGADEIAALAQSDSHQGFAAVIKDRPGLELKDLIKAEEGKEQSLIVVVDAVQDPQNIGTIFRAAECFGAAGVILSKNRSPGITPAVTKVSVGASELVRSVYVSNLAEAVRKLKDAQYWIVAARAGDDSQALSSFSFPKRSALIMGSEEEGIQALIEKEADFSVKIPLFGRIDSLNVSQAAAVMLYAARSQVD